jgi:hypothetical protein
MKAFNDETKSVPARVFAVVALVVPLAVTVYWVVTYGGLYAWLSDLQASVFPDDSYYPLVSGLLSWLALLLPFVGIKWAASRVLGKPHGSRTG